MAVGCRAGVRRDSGMMVDVAVLIDGWSGHLGIRYLEAGAGPTENGRIYTKTVPFGVLAEAVTGSYELEHSGRRIDGPTGSVIFAPPHVPLRFIHRHGPGNELSTIRYVHFTFLLWGGIDVLTLLDVPDRFGIDTSAAIGCHANAILDAESAGGTGVAALARRHELGFALLRLLASVCPARPGSDAVVGGAVRIAPLLATLAEGLAEPWTVQRMARLANLSRPTLHRDFLRTLGTPPMEHLRRWRLDEAARRLLRSEDSVARVAEEVGYGSPYHFSREFGRRFGVPPSVYRSSRGVFGQR